MTLQPALFVSHGAPTLAITPSPAGTYLAALGAALAPPAAIIVISAHHVARGVDITVDAAPQTIHDFSGFPEALHQITYPAPGAPGLAAELSKMLGAAGFEARLQSGRGFDHGAWVPLRLMFPQAGIPVLQVSVDMAQTPHWHFRLGQALAPLLARNILIIGSGSITHNLGEFFHGGYDVDAPRPDWVDAFAGWIAQNLEAGKIDRVLDAVEAGPFGKRNHPSMDHILPLFVALGAGGPRALARQLHTSTSYGVLVMDAYGFGENMQLSQLREAVILARTASPDV